MSEQYDRVWVYVKDTLKTQSKLVHAHKTALNTLGLVREDRYLCVALLHDMIEDGYATLVHLQQCFDFDDEQTAALDAITRRDGERYFTYIKRCKQNEMAKTVKLADLEDNINRCAKDLPNRWSMLCRYAKAYGILRGEWRESKR